MEEITEYDYKNVSKLSENEARALNKATAMKPMILFCVFFPLLIIALGGIWCITDLSFGLVFVGIGVLFGIVYPFIFKSSIEKTFKRQFNNDVSYVSTFYFTDSKIIIETDRKIASQDETYQPLGRSNLTYNDIVKAIEDENYIFLFVNRNQAHVITKINMFKGEISDFVVMLKSKIANYKTIIKTKKQG